jgi:hypothetical protein
MLHGLNELAPFCFLQDCELAIGQRNAQAASAEGADKDHLLGGLADVDEASGAGKFGPEFADVEIAGAVDLREAEKRGVARTRMN